MDGDDLRTLRAELSASAPKASGPRAVRIPVAEDGLPERFIVRPLTGRVRQDVLHTDLPLDVRLALACSASLIAPALPPERFMAMLWPNVAAVCFGIVAAGRLSTEGLPFAYACPREGCVDDAGGEPRQEVAIDISELADPGLIDEQDGWEDGGVRVRHLTLTEEAGLSEMEQENPDAAVRWFVENAVTDRGGRVLGGWNDVGAFYGVYADRMAHGMVLSTEVDCRWCGEPVRLPLMPQFFMADGSLAGLFAEVEAVTAIFKWPVDAILNMPDPVRGYWAERAQEIDRKRSEEASRARTKHRTG